MTTPVEVHSAAISGTGRRLVRPINNQVLVKRQASRQDYGAIIAVASEASIDVNISEVLSVSDKAKVKTRNGPLKAGDRVLSVRVVNKKVDDIDMRANGGERIGFIPDEHVLAIVSDDGIFPTNNVCLVEGVSDRRHYGDIVLTGVDSLDVHSCKILATGPDVTQLEAGEYAIMPSRFGVIIDSLEIRRKYSATLKLIKEQSIIGATNDPSVEGEAAANTPL